ncbi:TetR/AcrR family transcriptional regulator [Pseudonocardia petroleophila]|uniref:TetR/AcrR family transcriptional regulator n=1 Tax=Pseudonocardia petroleophila TaxID=37331 RepID=A0A7G7MH71_9PSEU|nr:TetR/AcrR family transcriptional regulator [Pseudonocardia petroleophila]QNG52132.1 TetR/AcrR family transcriptional regulator [Pseudonocardia petroleophila]
MDARREVRDHVVEAAARLLAEGGRDAVSTRAVAAAAGTQAPALYRLFGDKDGLLDAVAEHGFAAYLRTKVLDPPGDDPVEDLRAGWAVHVGFGLAHPALYLLMYGDPTSGRTSPAAERSWAVLRRHVRAIAAAGRLTVDERTAADLVHAAACGTVLTLLATPADDRDPALSDLARDTVLAAIATGAPPRREPGPVTAATTLRAGLDGITALTEGERHVLGEWLDRIAAGRAATASATPGRPGAGLTG